MAVHHLNILLDERQFQAVVKAKNKHKKVNWSDYLMQLIELDKEKD